MRFGKIWRRKGNKRLVILESPVKNFAYAKLCLRDSLDRGESPIASHMLYAAHGVHDDRDPNKLDFKKEARRLLTTMAWLAWYRIADACVIYTDMGETFEMMWGIKEAEEHGVPIERRSLESRG